MYIKNNKQRNCGYMYSTKNIEKILLAELSRWQYNQWMSDSLEQTDTTLRDTVKVYKNAAFQQIFGKERRIFLPIEIKISNEERFELQKSSFNSFPAYITERIIESYRIVYFAYFISISNIDRLTDIKYLKQILDNVDDMFNIYHDEIEYISEYINGIIINPKTNKPEKFGKFIKKIIDLFIKNNIWSKIQSNRNITYIFEQDYGILKINENDTKPQNVLEALQKILKTFNERKDWFPQDYLATFDTTPNKYYAVISRDPQDVGAMSTGQGWSSCQDLDKKK